VLDDLQTGSYQISNFKQSFSAETPHAFGIPNCVTPHVFRIPAQETPLSLGILRCQPWYGMDIFWNHPFHGI